MKKLVASLLALVVLAGCAGGNSGKDDKTIRVGASTTPHAEILKQVKPALEKEGYNLEIVEFTDYVKPNQALVDKDLDANYFQHKPYLLEWADKFKHNDELTDALAVHFEPMGIYSTKHSSLKDLKDGSKISIPNDPTNGGRALRLLADNGIIKLSKDEGIDVTLKDITENKKSVEIIEMQAEACAVNIQDVDYAVLNGNNALAADLNKKVITSESKESDAAKLYANLLVVRSEDKDSKKTKALVNALNSDTVKEYIDQTYDGVVVPLVPAK